MEEEACRGYGWTAFGAAGACVGRKTGGVGVLLRTGPRRNKFAGAYAKNLPPANFLNAAVKQIEVK